MGLFSKKEDKSKVAPKPIAGPTPPPAPAAPGVQSAPTAPRPVAPAAPSAPAAPGFSAQAKPAAPSVGPTPPPPGGFKPSAPAAPTGPSFGNPSTPSFGSNQPGNGSPSFGAMSNPGSDEATPQRKFDIFNENLAYVKFDFNKLKIDKLDLSTNPEPRQIRKHIKKLLELQKQLINMEKDLVCRRDFIDKYIFEEKQNQKPKILVDLLEGRDPNESQPENNADEQNKVEASEEKKSNAKKDSKESVKETKKLEEPKKESKTSTSAKASDTKKEKKSTDEDDIFKSVEDMLSSN